MISCPPTLSAKRRRRWRGHRPVRLEPTGRSDRRALGEPRRIVTEEDAADELAARADPDLLEDGLEVILDGPRGEVQATGDRACGQTLSDERATARSRSVSSYASAMRGASSCERAGSNVTAVGASGSWPSVEPRTVSQVPDGVGARARARAPLGSRPAAMLRARLATACTTGGRGASGPVAPSSASHSSAGESSRVMELSGASNARPADPSCSWCSPDSAVSTIARPSPSAR